MNTLADELLPGGAGQSMLAIIMADNRGIESCFTDFLKQWSEREVDATWQKLIDALVATKKYALAKELTEALTPTVKTMDGPQQATNQQQPSQQSQEVESFNQQNPWPPQPRPQMQDNNLPHRGDKGNQISYDASYDVTLINIAATS